MKIKQKNKNMKNKQILAVLFCAAICFSAHSQTVKNDLNYRKFLVSINAGLDFSPGASGTVLQMYPPLGDFALPSASMGFGAGFDGAYFLTKNYGVGLKYRFFISDGKRSALSEYADVENKYDYPIAVSTTSRIKEQTHAFGPAIYARWFLGQSRWNVSANAGIVYLYNTLPRIKGETKYNVYSKTDRENFEKDHSLNWYFVHSDYSGSTVGFTLSAGIRYQLNSTTGIGISANGLFASLFRMKQKEGIPEEYGVSGISRKINRTGISAGIDFSF